MSISRSLKIIYDFFVRYRKIKKDVTLVYTMGKVGSSSIYHSILDNVAQIHSLDEDIPTKYFISKDRSSWIGHLASRTIWKFVIKKVKKSIAKSKNVKIITGVREPFSRNISAYFQGLNVEEQKNYRIKDYLNEFHIVTNHTVPLYWFEFEIKKHLGIDIYQTNFNKELGYTILKKGKFEIFIYRLENLDDVIDKVEMFVGQHNFKYIKKNMTKKKFNNTLLSSFKNNISFSEEEIQAMYNSKYMRHFYTEKEIKQFKSKYAQ